MRVILLQDVENLGDQGEIVTVKDGYGRNYLIPQKLALLATDGVVRQQQELRRQVAHKLLKQKDDAEALAKIIQQEEYVIRAKVGEENRIFGTVTSQQIADRLAQRGIEVDRKKIELDEDIKLLGVYSASVRLHPEVIAKVKIRVESEDDGEGEE